MLSPTTDEIAQRDAVIGAIVAAVESGQTIRLPSFSSKDPGTYSGHVDCYRYQFEGEDDLLHLAVTRLDEKQLSAEEGQAVASFLMPGMPSGLVWIRPGEFSQHFYCGHDDLVQHVNRNR